MAIDKKIAFLGGGNMAEALIKGMLSADVAKSRQIVVTDTSPARLDYLKKYNLNLVKSNQEAVQGADIVLLCVKPQVMDAVLAEIAGVADSSKLVISIAAGITISRLEQALTANPRVIRVMPNTPALVLSGAAGLAKGSSATNEDLALAQEIFSAVGRAVVVDEKLMDAVTGLSGSGPAFVFTVIEALSDAGVKVGIPRPLGAGACRSDGLWFGEDGARHQRASCQTQGHGDLSRRHDHRRHARAGEGEAPGSADERSGSGDQKEQGARREDRERCQGKGWR